MYPISICTPKPCPGHPALLSALGHPFLRAWDPSLGSRERHKEPFPSRKMFSKLQVDPEVHLGRELKHAPAEGLVQGRWFDYKI